MSGMRQVRSGGLSSVVTGLLLVVAGCTEVDSGATAKNSDLGTGGVTTTMPSTGGAKSTGVGGAVAATGGRVSTGGALTNGGTIANGGATAMQTGGATALGIGGATTTATGGASSAGNGGIGAFGGAGAPGCGAPSTGGAQATGGTPVTTGGSSSTGGTIATGGTSSTGGKGTGGAAPQFPTLDYSCQYDSDCCVVLYSCMAQSYLVTKTQQSLVQAYVSALPQSPCVACIWPVVQVACVSGTCRGTVVPAMTVSETYAATHCGRLNLPVGGSAGAAGMTAAYSMTLPSAGAAGSANVAPIATGGTTSWHCGG